MPSQNDFFDQLCEQYYHKILLYLTHVLGDRDAAQDCTQEVFLTAYGKCSLLMQHPNPGGFVFLTAKNLSRKLQREAFRRMQTEALAESGDCDPADPHSSIEHFLDR